MDELVSKLVEQNQALIAALQQSSETKVQTQKVVGVTVSKYDENEESFDTYIERFTAYLDTQGVPVEQRGKVLISSLSAKMYNLLKSLLAPALPSEKTFEDLKTTLKNHLSPKPLIIPSRHAFLNRKQAEGESVSAYMAELRSLAVPCCYNAEMLNVMLRDVFVSGLRSRNILDRLFEEDDTGLDKTLNIALAMEKAVRGAKDVMGNSYDIKEFKVGKQNKQFKDSNPKGNGSFRGYEKKQGKDRACTRCTGVNHNSSNCKFKNSKCRNCSKVGHLEKACWNNPPNKPKKYVAQKKVDIDPSEDQIDSNIVPMFELKNKNSVQKRGPIMITVKIEGKLVSMELDTGGAVSVMSLDRFRKISGKDIKPTSTVFKTYKGDAVVPLGIVTVEVEYKNQKRDLNLYIVQENLDTILGREWLYEIQIDWPSLNAVQISTPIKNQLDKLLEDYRELFDDSIGEIKNYECKLELKPDARPVFCRPRIVPFALKGRVEEEIDRLEKDGIIEKCSISDWATPVVPVVKANGKIRLCADYSVTLNKHLKAQQHPLPRVEEIFSSLSDGKLFSKIDFSQAYLQMKMHTDSEELLTINTQKGLYKCKRLMYGVKAAPAVWQKYIEGVFQGLEGVEVFFDDARIAAPNVEVHFERLKKFLDRCLKNGLKINKEKSKFFQSEIEFLGFKVNEQGLSKTDEKIAAIKNAKVPKNIHDVQSFMGLVNFYGRFSKELATLAYPLHNLTKKGVPWKWDQSCKEAFENIKKEVCSDRILIHYDPNLPLILATDASPVGIGAVLSHRFPDGMERPISFASRTLTPTEQKYSQIDKEALGISWGVKKFYLYVKGRKFTLLTDHKPLVAIFGSKKGLPVCSATRLLHYALQLQGFDFDIEYRNTKEHGNADCLSRLPLESKELEIKDDIEMFQLTQIETMPVTAKDLARATAKDPELIPLLQTLQSGGLLEGREAEYGLQDGCILYGQRVCVPKCYRNKVLEELHHGHLGIVKMKAIARSFVYWKGIDRDIEVSAKKCGECAKHKSDPAKARVHHWEYPSAPWERIHVDFAGPIFEHTFLLVVDAHSKWLEVFPLKSTTSARTIECLRETFSRFGLPLVLVSDNGPQFTSFEFQNFLKSNGIKHKTCAPFKPSSNGQAERYVYTLKQSLRAMSNYPGTLRQKLHTFLMQCRKAPNATTLQSPSMLFLKREIRTRIDLVRPNTKLDTETRMRETNDFSDRFFRAGDKVSARNYRQGDTKWRVGTVISREGQLHYTVSVGGQLWRRHVDQLRDAGELTLPPAIVPYPAIPPIPDPDPRDVPSTSATSEGASVSEGPGAMVNQEVAMSCQDAHVQPTPTVPPRCPVRPEVPVPADPVRRSSRVRRPPKRLNL